MSIQDDMRLNEYLIMQSELRHAKRKHIVYRTFPDIRDMQCFVYWGVFSWTIPSENMRWIKKNSAITTIGLVSTPGDITRDYLDYYHPTRLRAIHAEITTYEKYSTAPLFVNPTILLNGTYVDICSAYFSILCITGWNVAYLPNQWLSAGRAPLDFPLKEVKSARNYLVSIGLPTPLSLWDGNKMIYRNAPHIHKNLGLWTLVMDILHALAGIAIKLGACYVHTDGCILPSENVPYMLQAISDFHLTGRIVAEGKTFVAGFGNYMVGDKKTKRFEPDRWQGVYSNVRRVNTLWLMKSIDTLYKTGVASRLFDKSVLR